MPTREELARIDEAFGDETGRLAAQKRVDAGEPVAYVTGEQAFYGESYSVGPGTLIPRFDTERVVDAALRRIKALDDPKLLELCTGSGCISVSADLHWRDKNGRGASDGTVTACDISEEALSRARLNVEKYGVSDKIALRSCDVTKPSDAASLCGNARYDLIVANPPYIRSAVVETLDRSVRDFEPLTALDGGVDGLAFYRAILENFTRFLTPAGRFIFEIGYDQRGDIEGLGRDAGFEVSVARDWGGNDRVAELFRAP